jgi:hypothetical protein
MDIRLTPVTARLLGVGVSHEFGSYSSIAGWSVDDSDCGADRDFPVD